MDNSTASAPEGTTSRCIIFIILLMCTIMGTLGNLYSLWRMGQRGMVARKHPCITNICAISVVMCLAYTPLEMTNNFMYIFHAYNPSLVLFKSMIWECALWVYCISLSGVAVQRLRIMRLRVSKLST